VQSPSSPALSRAPSSAPTNKLGLSPSVAAGATAAAGPEDWTWVAVVGGEVGEVREVLAPATKKPRARKRRQTAAADATGEPAAATPATTTPPPRSQPRTGQLPQLGGYGLP
jgi:hypothetical protein